MLDITLKSLTLPEKREEAEKYLTTLQVFLMSAINAAIHEQNKARDLAKTFTHLEAIYMKKYGSKS
jgi:hypothetical protein